MKKSIYVAALAVPLVFPYVAQAQVNTPTPTLRLDLAKVRLMLQQGEEVEAVALLRELEREHPLTAQFLAVKSLAEFQIGRTRKALALITRAINVAPENEDFQNQREDILKGLRSFVRASYPIRSTDNTSTERHTLLEGAYVHHYRTRLGARLERNDVNISNFIRPSDGATQRISAVRYRSEAYLAHDYENGNQARASLYQGKGAVGFGASYLWRDIKGATTAFIDVNKPEWDFLESLIDGGVKDAIGLARTHRIRTRLNVEGSAAFNRYGINDSDNAATSLEARAAIRYALSPRNKLRSYLGEEGSISIGYAIDAEYAFALEDRVDVNGAIYRPIPLASREIHTVDLSVAKRFNREFFGEASLGYAYDRLGSDTPSLALRLTYTPKQIKPLEINLEASRSISTDAISETEENIGVTATWRF